MTKSFKLITRENKFLGSVLYIIQQTETVDGKKYISDFNEYSNKDTAQSKLSLMQLLNK